LKGRANVFCRGVTTDGGEVPLGRWEGSTENATGATALLADLVERGLDTGQGGQRPRRLRNQRAARHSS